jgi:putative tryptophan/tyrosine transport system substrate-binding protein
MQRRKFIAAIVNTIAAAPAFGLRLASAQQAEKVSRVGVLMGLSESNPEHRNLLAASLEELARLGWVDGRTARIEQRWTDGDLKRASAFARELVAAQPDVILASPTPVTAALHRETTTVPIVFATVSDPIGAGFVAGLPHPGGNITGFTHVDPALGGKWLGLLKEIAPGIKRAGIMFNPDTAPAAGNFFLGSFEAAARLLAIDPVKMPVRNRDRGCWAWLRASRRRCHGRLVHVHPFWNDHFLDDSAQRAGDLRDATACQGRRPNLIRGGPTRHLSPCG